MKILFLDDNPERHRRFAQSHIGEEVTQVDTAERAIDTLEGDPRWDIVSLDHDLSFEQQMACVKGEALPAKGDGSGYDVALWMRRNARYLQIGHVIIHSFNPGGVDRMYSALREEFNVEKRPFDY